MSMDNRYAYLLAQLGINCGSNPSEKIVINAMNESSKELKLSMWLGTIQYKKNQDSNDKHIFFNLPDQKRDDEYATKIAEGILLLTEMFHGPLFDMSYYYTFPFRIEKIRNKTNILNSDLIEEIETLIEDSHMLWLHSMLHTITSVSNDTISLSIKTLPTLLRNQSIYMAVAFFSQSLHDFYVYPGQWRDAIYDGDWIPTRASEMARWESAYQNFYKSIESIIGDPPRNDERFYSRLIKAGINPDEEVGYFEKRTISSVIREMNRIRDTRAAHGSSPRRGIQFSQMYEFQECASYIIHMALQKCYGKRLE